MMELEAQKNQIKTVQQGKVENTGSSAVLPLKNNEKQMSG